MNDEQTPITRKALVAVVDAARRNAHREGYELARKEAAQIGCHLRAYDVVMAERVV